MVHIEATLKDLKKPDLIKLVLQLDIKYIKYIKIYKITDIKYLTSEIRHFVTQMKKVEVDVAIVKNVNQKLVN